MDEHDPKKLAIAHELVVERLKPLLRVCEEHGLTEWGSRFDGVWHALEKAEYGRALSLYKVVSHDLIEKARNVGIVLRHLDDEPAWAHEERMRAQAAHSELHALCNTAHELFEPMNILRVFWNYAIWNGPEVAPVESHNIIFINSDD